MYIYVYIYISTQIHVCIHTYIYIHIYQHCAGLSTLLASYIAETLWRSVNGHAKLTRERLLIKPIRELVEQLDVFLEVTNIYVYIVCE